MNASFLRVHLRAARLVNALEAVAHVTGETEATEPVDAFLDVCYRSLLQLLHRLGLLLSLRAGLDF